MKNKDTKKNKKITPKKTEKIIVEKKEETFSVIQKEEPKQKKDYKLLKVIVISFLIVALLTWLIPTGSFQGTEYVESALSPIGIFDLFITPLKTIVSSVHISIVILVIGGFYGILNKTGAYSKIINNIVEKRKGKEVSTVIMISIILILMQAIVGSTYLTILMIPFFVTIILSLKQTKFTALLATFGATMIGTIASITGKDLLSYMIDFGVKATDNLVIKIILLVAVIVALAFFISILVEKNKKSKTKEENEIPLYKDNIDKKKPTSPLIIIAIILLLVLTVGMFEWEAVFNMNIFTNFHQSLINVKIGTFPIFQNLLGSVNPIGYFGITELVVILTMASLVIGWIYNIKFKEGFTAFIEGMKEMLYPAIIAALVNLILIGIIGNETILYPILNLINGLSKTFSSLVASLMALVTSIFYNEFYYVAGSNFSFFKLAEANTTLYPLIGLIFQTVFGLVMMVVPTSIVLMTGLSYMKVDYKTWLKNSWKLLLALAAIIVIVITIITIF